MYNLHYMIINALYYDGIKSIHVICSPKTKSLYMLYTVVFY